MHIRRHEKENPDLTLQTFYDEITKKEADRFKAGFKVKPEDLRIGSVKRRGKIVEMNLIEYVMAVFNKVELTEEERTSLYNALFYIQTSIEDYLFYSVDPVKNN